MCNRLRQTFDIEKSLKHCLTTALRFVALEFVSNFKTDVGLAKAAVNGDEAALDIFSDWRPRTTARQFRLHDGNDNQCFFVGTQSGE